MAKASTRVTGNDPVADPGGTRGKPAKTAKTTETVKSGDRNDRPAKPETRIKKK